MRGLRTVGFLGGMSYHSTVPYYTKINRRVQDVLGAPHTAQLILHSFNYADVSPLLAQEKWPAVTDKFVVAGKHLKASGAQALAIGCNIGHVVADELQSAVGLPVLHIADATAAEIEQREVRCVALIGTRPVMERGFISSRLLMRSESLRRVLVPEPSEWDRLNDIIFQELAAGPAKGESKTWMLSLARRFREQGADALVLACTDFQAIIRPEEPGVGPVLDTLDVHARYIADWCMGDA